MALFGGGQPAPQGRSGPFGGQINNATNQPEHKQPVSSPLSFGALNRAPAQQATNLFANVDSSGNKVPELFGTTRQQSQPPQVKKEDATTSSKTKERFAHDQIIE